jgi:hypothetical protein
MSNRLVRTLLVFAISVPPAVALTVSTSVVFASQANAQVNCVSPDKSLFDGYLSTAAGPGGYQYEGASAAIIANAAPLCTTGFGPDEFSYTWVMVHQSNSGPGGGNNGYAQMGFFRDVTESCPYYTSESDQIYGQTFFRHIHTEYGCLPTNQLNRYWVQYIPSTGLLRMNVDVTIMDTTTWNPYLNWAAPFSTDFDSETKYIGSDVPATNYRSMQVQQGINHGWSSSLPQMYTTCPWPIRYVLGALSNNFFAIQTYGSSSGYNCQ